MNMAHHNVVEYESAFAVYARRDKQKSLSHNMILTKPIMIYFNKINSENKLQGFGLELTPIKQLKTYSLY